MEHLNHLLTDKSPDKTLKYILAEFGNLPCELSKLKVRADYVQLQFGAKRVHYEWWLRKEAGELHVAVHFERDKPESDKNFRNAEQLRGKVEAIAKTLGAQTKIGFRTSSKTWTTAAVVFDLSGESPSDVAKKAVGAMLLLVETTLQDVKQMCDAATVEC